MNFLAEWRRPREATDTDSSSSFWTPKAQRQASPDQNGVDMTKKTQPINRSDWLKDSATHSGRPSGAPKPGGASFADSPLIANVEPHETYKIHVATKSKRIRDTPGIVCRVVEDVARLYYATGERPGLSLQGIPGKGGWEEFTVAIGPLKDSPLALAMYRVDVFMKAFISGGRYFPQSGSSLDETRRLARMNKRLEGDRQKEGKDLYDWAKQEWGGCYDFQNDKCLKNLYQKYKPLKVKGTGSDSYCFKPYVRSCSVSKDGKTFFFEPDIHVEHHGYNTRDGTPDDFSFYENQKEYVQLVKQAINSNSDLAYDLDIIHVACCAYALVQSLPPRKVYNLRDDAPVPEDKEKMELLSPLQYGIVHHCLECSTGHLSGGVQPIWAKIDPKVGSPPSMEMSFAFNLPTMGAEHLRKCLRDYWSERLVENLDETLVLDVAMHDRPYLPAKDYSYNRSQASAVLERNPHKSQLVGPSERFESYLELVEYYKSGTEKLRAAYKKEPGAFTLRWKMNVFDAGAAILQLAKNAAVLELENNKGDSEIVAIVHRRLNECEILEKPGNIYDSSGRDRYYACLRHHRYFPDYSAELQGEIERKGRPPGPFRPKIPTCNCSRGQAIWEEREENKRKEEKKWAHEAKVQKRDNLKQQLAKLERGGNRIEKAHVLFNLGTAQSALAGHSVTARGFYQRALDVFKREYGTDDLRTKLCRRQLELCPEPEPERYHRPEPEPERSWRPQIPGCSSCHWDEKLQKYVPNCCR